MNRKEKSQAIAANQPWDQQPLAPLSALRSQAQKAWSTTVREKKPLSLKHLRGLGCDGY